MAARHLRIDEEEIDDRDNDYDASRTRTPASPGMDDDDDALLDKSMIGTDPAPMVWADNPAHANNCPDINILNPMLPRALRAQVLHRLAGAPHLPGAARRRGHPEALLLEVPGELAGNKNCLEDYAKLSDAYKAEARKESPPTRISRTPSTTPASSSTSGSRAYRPIRNGPRAYSGWMRRSPTGWTTTATAGSTRI